MSKRTPPLETFGVQQDGLFDAQELGLTIKQQGQQRELGGFTVQNSQGPDFSVPQADGRPHEVDLHPNTVERMSGETSKPYNDN